MVRSYLVVILSLVFCPCAVNAQEPYEFSESSFEGRQMDILVLEEPSDVTAFEELLPSDYGGGAAADTLSGPDDVNVDEYSHVLWEEGRPEYVRPWEQKGEKPPWELSAYDPTSENLCRSVRMLIENADRLQRLQCSRESVLLAMTMKVKLAEKLAELKAKLGQRVDDSVALDFLCTRYQIEFEILVYLRKCASRKLDPLAPVNEPDGLASYSTILDPFEYLSAAEFQLDLDRDGLDYSRE